MTGMIAVFGAAVHLISRTHIVLPPFTWWIATSGSGLVLPACLFGLLHHGTHPVHDRLHRECRSRSLMHESAGIRLETRTLGFFFAVSAGLLLWAGAFGFSEGACRVEGVQAGLFTLLGVAGFLCMIWLAAAAHFTMFIAPVKGTADMIGYLSAGGWSGTARLAVDSGDDVGKAAAGINDLMDRINEAVRGVEETAAGVEQSSRDVSSCADDLMSLLLEQAASVEAVAQTIEEMTSFIKQNALSAESSRGKTRSMVNMAGRSETSMRALVDAMEGISLASRKIGELSETIEKFASISSEQADRVDDLNKSVARMDSVTQRNAAAIHRLSGSAEGMLCSAGTLAGEVTRFKQAVSGRPAAGSRFRSLASCGEEADDQEIE